jgi:hypothetical protein
VSQVTVHHQEKLELSVSRTSHLLAIWAGVMLAVYAALHARQADLFGYVFTVQQWCTDILLASVLCANLAMSASKETLPKKLSALVFVVVGYLMSYMVWAPPRWPATRSYPLVVILAVAVHPGLTRGSPVVHPQVWHATDSAYERIDLAVLSRFGSWQDGAWADTSTYRIDALEECRRGKLQARINLETLVGDVATFSSGASNRSALAAELLRAPISARALAEWTELRAPCVRKISNHWTRAVQTHFCSCSAGTTTPPAYILDVRLGGRGVRGHALPAGRRWLWERRGGVDDVRGMGRLVRRRRPRLQRALGPERRRVPARSGPRQPRVRPYYMCSLIQPPIQTSIYIRAQRRNQTEKREDGVPARFGPR